jgi:NTP pyrophosphatase (non-canonical NTP hydrolase)
MINDLTQISKNVHANAVEKGFWSHEVNDLFVTKQLMMIVSEAVETMEAVRKDLGPDEVAEEMADIIIRTLDLYEGLLENGYVTEPLQPVLNKKIDYNRTRPERHGVKF